MHLDEAEVARRVALQRGDRGHGGGQAGCAHRLAQRDAGGVALLEPARVEVAGQRARAEEGRRVALAFLLGEADDLDAVRQAAAGAVQLAHAGHRHQDAEPAVVLAAVVHGVVVAAGQQAAGVGVGAVVEPDDVADRVDRDLVEAAFLAHPARELARAGLVRGREVAHAELAALAPAGVAVHGQRLGPVPDPLAERGRDAVAVVEPQLGDAVDLAQAFGELALGRAGQPALEAGDDLGAAQAAAAWPAHGENERPAKARLVLGVEALDLLELGRRAGGEPGLALLLARCAGQRARDHRLAGQLGVRAQQRELGLAAGLAHGLDQRALQGRERAVAAGRAARAGALGDPRRVFVDAVEQRDEFGGRCAV